MAENDVAPIIIRRKKGGHGGHHGGAWKVAYADFVTAMMALFIVLWLMSSSSNVKKAIAGYFNDPKGFAKHLGSGAGGSGEGVALGRNDMGKLKEALEGAMRNMPEFQAIKDQVKMSVTGEGLRVELLEGEKETFFDSGSSHPSNNGQETLEMLAKELGKLTNDIVIEGHTDAKPFASDKGYTNWELSADRANAARRLMETSGLRPGQVVQIRGFADRTLRNAGKPEDPSNRRVSVIVRYRAAKPGEEEAAEPGKPESPSPVHTTPKPDAHSPPAPSQAAAHEPKKDSGHH